MPSPEVLNDRVTQMRAVFDTIDRNHDGSINVRELLLCLRKHPDVAEFMHLPMHVHQEGGTRETFEEMFQAIDKDGSRDVTWAEFESYFTWARRNVPLGGRFNGSVVLPGGGGGDTTRATAGTGTGSGSESAVEEVSGGSVSAGNGRLGSAGHHHHHHHRYTAADTQASGTSCDVTMEEGRIDSMDVLAALHGLIMGEQAAATNAPTAGTEGSGANNDGTLDNVPISKAEDIATQSRSSNRRSRHRQVASPRRAARTTSSSSPPSSSSPASAASVSSASSLSKGSTGRRLGKASDRLNDGEKGGDGVGREGVHGESRGRQRPPRHPPHQPPSSRPPRQPRLSRRTREGFAALLAPVAQMKDAIDRAKEEETPAADTVSAAGHKSSRDLRRTLRRLLKAILRSTSQLQHAFVGMEHELRRSKRNARSGTGGGDGDRERRRNGEGGGDKDGALNNDHDDDDDSDADTGEQTRNTNDAGGGVATASTATGEALLPCDNAGCRYFWCDQLGVGAQDHAVLLDEVRRVSDACTALEGDVVSLKREQSDLTRALIDENERNNKLNIQILAHDMDAENEVYALQKALREKGAECEQLQECLRQREASDAREVHESASKSASDSEGEGGGESGGKSGGESEGESRAESGSQSDNVGRFETNTKRVKPAVRRGRRSHGRGIGDGGNGVAKKRGGEVAKGSLVASKAAKAATPVKPAKMAKAATSAKAVKAATSVKAMAATKASKCGSRPPFRSRATKVGSQRSQPPFQGTTRGRQRRSMFSAPGGLPVPTWNGHEQESQGVLHRERRGGAVIAARSGHGLGSIRGATHVKGSIYMQQQVARYMQDTDVSKHHHDGDDPAMKEKHDAELAREREAREKWEREHPSRRQ